jgi:glycosyltransferase involved in cell wall biosynthesis
MRICFITDNLNSGGKERQLYELIKGLVANGSYDCSDILVISFDNPAYYDGFVLSLNISVINIRKKNGSDINALRQLYIAIKRFNPNVVHSINTLLTFWALLLKLFLRYKLIDGSFRTGTPIKAQGIQKRLLSSINITCSDIIISNSRAGLVNSYGENKKSIVIPNGFDQLRIQSSDKEGLKKELSIDQKYVIGMMATFSHKKDYKLFVDVVKFYHSHENDDILFLTIGCGPDFDKIVSYSSKLNNIRHLGHMNDPGKIMNIMDLGILFTAPPYQEGISNTIMEYMAHEIPVMANNFGGNPEIITDGVHGILINEREPEFISREINKLLSQNSKLKSMGQKAKIHIKQNFSFQKMISAYEKLYTSLH